MDNTNQDIWEYIRIILRRKWVIILPTILCAGIAVYIAYNLPAYYRSTTLILVEKQKISEAYVQSTDATPFEQRLNTIKQQVMSRTNLERIISDFNLYAKPDDDPASKVRKKLSSLGLLSNATRSKEEIVDGMREEIEINIIGGRRGGGDAFRISYIGKDPYITMQVTNTLSSLFIEENLRIKEQYAEGTSEFLLKELEKAKEELAGQENSLRKFKESHIGALPEQLDANLRTLDRLQLELQSVNEAIRSSVDQKGFLERQHERANQIQLQPQPQSTLVAEVSPGTSSEEELTFLENRLASLLSIYKDTYPDVIVVRNRINELRGILEREKAEKLKVAKNNPDQEPEQEIVVDTSRQATFEADIASIRSHISSLRNRHKKILSSIREFEKRVEVTPANEQMLSDLTRDYGVTLQNYQDLLAKRLNARLAENLEKKQKGARFRVIDPANPPEKPFKPNRRLIAILGAVAGVAIGGGIVFLLEFLTTSFRKPEDFVGVVDIPVLASIPLFTIEAKPVSTKSSKTVNGNKKERVV